MELASVLTAGFCCLMSLYGIFASRRRMSRMGFYYSTLGFGMLTYAFAAAAEGYLVTIALVALFGSLLAWLPQLLGGTES